MWVFPTNQFSSIFIFLLWCHIITFSSVVQLHATVSLGDWCQVSQDSDVFFHQGLKSPQGMTWILFPQRWEHYAVSKHLAPITQWQTSTSQKRSLSYTNVIVLNHIMLFIYLLQMTLSDSCFSYMFSLLLFSPASILSPHLSIFLLFCLLISPMQLFHFIFNFICPFHWISPFTFPSLFPWSLLSDIDPYSLFFICTFISTPPPWLSHSPVLVHTLPISALFSMCSFLTYLEDEGNSILWNILQP